MRTFGRLREKIKEKYDTLDNFANAIGKSRTIISFKLSGKSDWRLDEIEFICRLLDIPIEKIPDYFFYNE